MSAAQPSLFDNGRRPPRTVHRRIPANWQERFDQFHARKPQVYAMLVALARDIRRRWPNRRVGIELLMNRVRWEFSFDQSDSGEDFKINQNFAAYYSRLIMNQEADLRGMFELRQLASEGRGRRRP